MSSPTPMDELYSGLGRVVAPKYPTGEKNKIEPPIGPNTNTCGAEVMCKCTYRCAQYVMFKPTTSSLT